MIIVFVLSCMMFQYGSIQASAFNAPGKAAAESEPSVLSSKDKEAYKKFVLNHMKEKAEREGIAISAVKFTEDEMHELSWKYLLAPAVRPGITADNLGLFGAERCLKTLETTNKELLKLLIQAAYKPDAIFNDPLLQKDGVMRKNG